MMAYDDDSGIDEPPDIVCFSPLRWDYEYRRPQHLLGRAAKDRRVYVVEEPVFDGIAPRLDVARRPEGIWVAVPHLPLGTSAEDADRLQKTMLDGMLRECGLMDSIFWYCTPDALSFSGHLSPRGIVYDVMDDLPPLRCGTPEAARRRADLVRHADVVFTAGANRYEAIREHRSNVHLFPSSIDAEHFRAARRSCEEPADQVDLPRPRLGFYGGVDERVDTGLLAAVADARPDWQLIVVGPLVNVEAASLPRRANLHYLGDRSYAELPGHLGGWDVAVMPWSAHGATRSIVATKTPECLAAGVPVVSTAVRDVVRPYGEERLVRTAASPEEFVSAIEAALEESPAARSAWLARVDARLARGSWDHIWTEMQAVIDAVVPRSLSGRSRAERRSRRTARSSFEYATLAAD